MNMAQKTKDFTGGLNALISGIAPTAPAAAPQAQAPKQTGKKPTAPKKAKATTSTLPAAPEQKPKRGRGRPRKESTEAEQRTTLILSTDMLQEIKAISYKETGKEGKKVLIKDIIAEALQRYIDEYNRKA